MQISGPHFISTESDPLGWDLENCVLRSSLSDSNYQPGLGIIALNHSHFS